MQEFEGRRVVVMGLGRFGGGLGVTRWLAEQGADVLVTDLESEDLLDESVRELRSVTRAGSVELRLGGHNISDFTTCDTVVVNPAAPRPWDNRFVRAAQASGAEVTTEIVLALERLPSPERVVAVTGSAGKSTTCSMIHHALTAAGIRSHLGGNVGGSLLDGAQKISPTDAVVLELSSAMLHWIDATGTHALRPRIGVVTNLSPNHLDWHDSLEHYEQSKRVLVHRLAPGATLVLGHDAPPWERLRDDIDHTRVSAPVEGLSIPGRHNGFNAAIAAAACAAVLDKDPAAFERDLRTFPGLPHRLALAGKSSDVLAYDDSKATTPEASVLAVRALGESLAEGTRGVHLIAGGYDKGANLTAISDLAPQIAGLYTIGSTGDAIADTADGRATRCGTLERAVRDALANARPGHAILLSPGCASWDQFENFEARGRRFVSLFLEASKHAMGAR